MPYSSNGRLCFSSEKHVQDYYNWLSNKVSTYEFRELDCTPLGNVIGLPHGSELDACGSCRSKRAGKTFSIHQFNPTFGDDLVHSWHYVNNEGTIFNNTLILNLCEKYDKKNYLTNFGYVDFEQPNFTIP